MIDKISHPKAKLYEALSIDKFKGNTRREKYQCIITDPVNKVVLDILPERYSHYLTQHFKSFCRDDINNVFCQRYVETIFGHFRRMVKSATQIIG